jgi:hypothetical protein
MRKRWMTLFLLMVAAVFAQSEDDFEIIQKSGGITIVGYAGNQTEIVIPARISGIAVASIGPSAFAGKQLTSITLPAGLRTIEDSAFSDNRLVSVAIPDTVTGIADGAFSNNQIVDLVLPSRLAFLGGGAFMNNMLETLTIPARLDHIPGSAFRGNPIRILDLGGAKTVVARAFEGSVVESVRAVAGANINALCGLDPAFVSFYNGNGKRAGTYAKNGRVWAAR